MPSRMSEADAVASAECGDVDGLALWCKQMGGASAVNTTLSTGSTLLHVAAESGQLGVVQFLIDSGAALMVDSDGQNALHSAAVSGHASVIAALIEAYGPAAAQEVNRRDQYRMTPLHLAVEGGHLAATSYLVSLPQLAGRSRRDSIHFIALRHGHRRVLKVLEENTPETPPETPSPQLAPQVKHAPLSSLHTLTNDARTEGDGGSSFSAKPAPLAAAAPPPKPVHSRPRWRLGKFWERLGRPRNKRAHVSHRAERQHRVFAWGREATASA